jgi:hypothetical protein
MLQFSRTDELLRDRSYIRYTCHCSLTGVPCASGNLSRAASRLGTIGFAGDEGRTWHTVLSTPRGDMLRAWLAQGRGAEASSVSGARWRRQSTHWHLMVNDISQQA